jgi:monoamine oxidase
LMSRFVVMATPFSAVRNIAFMPALPAAQADAVEGAVYSATTQFHFAVEQPYWEMDGLPSSLWSDRAYERGFHVSNRGGGKHGVLIIWLNGDGAMRLHGMDIDSQRAYILAELAKGRPSTKGALSPLLHYSWDQNPFVGGNKHCFAVGQIRRFGKEMALPHGRVHWAGEHLRRIELGMESAMETAEIAAAEIIAKA